MHIVYLIKKNKNINIKAKKPPYLLALGLGLIPLRRVQTIRNLDGILIVRRRRVTLPHLHDLGMNATTVKGILIQVQVRRRIPLVAALVAKVAGLRKVKVHALQLLLGRPLAQLVARLVGNHLEDVCAHVPAAERGQVPVGRHRGNFRVVVVKVVVGGADELLGDGVAKDDAEDPVALRVRLVLVKGQQHQRVLHKVLVV